MVKTEEQLKKIVEDLYLRIKAGQMPETKNTELKAEWYNLSKSVKGDAYKISISKFVKEITAMANNYGPWSGHLIVGLSENGIITDSPFKKSGLKDETELYSLIVSCVDKPFNFETYEILTNIDGADKTVTVLVIPPSIEKPHVMYEYVTEKGRYENYTPVKKGTAVRPASRNDLDLMYYDNQNIIPEYAINLKTYKRSLVDIKMAGASIAIDMPVIFENYGRKPMILVGCDLKILESDGVELNPEITLNLGAHSIANVVNTRKEIIQQPIIVPSNEVLVLTCHFYSWSVIDYEKVKSGKLFCFFIVEDVFGNKYESKYFRTGV